MKHEPTAPRTTHDYVSYLRRCKEEGALYTSDIAFHFRVSTPTAYRELVRLEKAGEVERQASGNSISWRPYAADDRG